MKIKARRVKHGWRYKVTDDKRMIKVEGITKKYKKEAKAEALKAYQNEIENERINNRNNKRI